MGFSMNQANLYLTRPSTTQPINALLASPNNALHLKHYTDRVAFGIGVDLGSLYKEELADLLVSIKIGYRFSIDGALPWYDGAVSWQPININTLSQLPPATIPSVPVDHFNHFFFQLNIGLVANWNRKKGEI